MTFILIICLIACTCLTANQVSRSFTLDGLRSDTVIIMYFIPTYHEIVRRQRLLPWLTLYVRRHLNFACGHQNPA